LLVPACLSVVLLLISNQFLVKPNRLIKDL
jgi:hypothetical protein